MANISKAISLGNGATNDSLDSTQRTQRVTLYDESGIPIEVNASGQLKVVLDGKICVNCTTTTPLLAGATFIGVASETLDYALIFVNVYSDVASATDGLLIEISSDGTTWYEGDKFTIDAGVSKTFSLQPNRRYFRVVYTNGGTNQATFDLETVFKKTNSKPSSHRIADVISPEDDATLQKSVLTAQVVGGDFVNVNATDSGNMKVTEVENPLAISKGDVVNTTAVNKFGENPDIDTATTPEEIWDYGGTYNFSTTADIDSISSSDINDIEDITIQGLDTNWELVEQVVTLTGQTRVSLTTSLVRVFRAYDSNGVNLLGDIYIYVNTALSGGIPVDGTQIRAMIRYDNNQTLMCVYTVPAGKTAYMLSSYVSLANTRTVNAVLTMRARLFGGVFRTQSKIAIDSTGNSSFIRTPAVPSKMPEKTDIIIRCEDVTANDTAISAGFDLILIDN